MMFATLKPTALPAGIHLFVLHTHTHTREEGGADINADKSGLTGLAKVGDSYFLVFTCSAQERQVRNQFKHRPHDISTKGYQKTRKGCLLPKEKSTLIPSFNGSRHKQEQQIGC